MVRARWFPVFFTLLSAACTTRTTSTLPLAQTASARPSASAGPAEREGAHANSDRREDPHPRVRYSVRDDATGEEIPARLIVRGDQGTPDPDLGPPERASGARTLVAAVSGHGELVLPPGHYRFTFARGPEWDAVTVRVDVSHAPRAQLEARLHHLFPMPEWTGCDLHVHSAPSGDSRVSVADRVAELVSVGVQYAAATEHNHVGDYTAAVRALDERAPRAAHGFAWSSAVEITTPTDGHFNAYPFPRDNSRPDGRPPIHWVPPSVFFREVRERAPDAVIQVNHPRMSPGIGHFDQAGLDTARNVAAHPEMYDPGYDVIEVFNGYYLQHVAETERTLGDWFQLLRSGARYSGTASSDSHWVAFSQAGFPRTYVATPSGGPVDGVRVARAVREGRAFGTSGPLLFASVEGAAPGDTLRAAGRAALPLNVSVRVLAAPYVDVNRIEVYRDGVLVAQRPVAPSTQGVRFEGVIEAPPALVPETALPRAGDGFVIVVARGARPMELVLPNQGALPFAFTNPIWIDEQAGGRRRSGARRLRPNVRHGRVQPAVSSRSAT